MSPKATSRADTWRVGNDTAPWSNGCTVQDITDVLTGAVVIGVVRSTRRGAPKAVPTEMRSTLLASSAMTGRPEEDVMRKPVTGEAGTGRRG